jgi:hypothetical protein
MHEKQNRGGCSVARNRTRTRGKCGGHPTTIRRQRPVAGRIHASVNHMQLASYEPAPDGVPVDPGLEQLGPGNHPVLSVGEAANPAIH